jgi:hypothetical protein
MRLILVVTMMSLPAAAFAQQPSGSSRVYVGGLGGVAISDQRGPLVAGQAGVRIADGLYVTGEAGLIANVLPNPLRDEVDVVGRLLTLENGPETAFEARLRSRYVAGGVRWMRPIHGIGLFAEGSIGAAFMTLAIDSTGNNPSAGAQDLEVEVLHDHPGTTSGTHMTGAVGGGVTVPVGDRWYVDGGFRYSWITTDPAIHLHIPYAALRFAF